MSLKGKVFGFQLYETTGGNISLSDITTRDLIDILNSIRKEYKLTELLEYKTKLNTHANDTNDPHNTVIETLPDDVLNDMYKEYLKKGYTGDFDFFKDYIFRFLKLANEQDILTDTEDMAMVVNKFIDCIRWHHIGPVYGHPVILDKIFVGDLCIPIEEYDELWCNMNIETNINTEIGSLLIDMSLTKYDQLTRFIKISNKYNQVLIDMYTPANKDDELYIVFNNKNNTQKVLHITSIPKDQTLILSFDRSRISLTYLKDDQPFTIGIARETQAFEPGLDTPKLTLGTKLYLNKVTKFQYYQKYLSLEEVRCLLID